MKTCWQIVLLFFLLSGASLQACVAQGILEELRNAVKDKTVVLLGEPTHGEGNVISCKTEIVRYLHDSLNFKILAFESGLYDLYYAQDLISKNAGSDPKIFLDNSLFPIWTGAKQFQPLLDYIGTAGSTLKVAGFDCQLSGKYSELYLTDSLQAFIRRHHPNARIDTAILEQVVAAFSESYSFPPDVDYSRFHSAINSVIQILSAIAGTGHLPPSEAALCVLYRQSAKNLKGLAVDYTQKKGKLPDAAHFKASDSNIRDSLMAESLLALTKIYPGQKIICWGGGTHFINDTRGMANAELRLYRSMGMRVKAALGEKKVLNLTFVSPAGSYGLVNEEPKKVPAPSANSLEKTLSTDSSAFPSRYIDLHSAEYQNRVFVSSALEYQPVQANWSRLFDGFIFLKAYEPMSYVYARVATDTPSAKPIADTLSGNKIPANSFHTLTGTVIDAENKEPLSFATVRPAGTGAGTICNNKGEFKLTEPMRSDDSLVVTAIGYRPVVIPAGSLQPGVIALARESQTLESATVTAKGPDALSIIKAAVAHYDLNYGQSAYTQYAYVNSRNVNNGVVFAEADYTADVYYIDMANVPKANFKEKNVKTFDSALIEKIGLFNNLPYDVIKFDLIRSGLFLTGSRYRGYTYRLIRSYNDSLDGPIYILHFEANKKGYAFTRDFFTASMSGELVIRKQDYAVISVNYQLVRKTDKLRKWAEKYYNTKSDKAGYYNKIPENEQVSFYCRYSKDVGPGKYFLRYANEVFSEKGMLQNDQAPLNLVSDLSFFDLGRISAIGDQAKLPFSTFRPYIEAKYDPGFWENFKYPMLNRYDGPTPAK